MKEIVKVSAFIVIFMAIVLVIMIIATELLFDTAVEQIIDNYQDELVYPTRFSVPSDAMRLNPFYMPNNVKESTEEYVPPVYDIVNVNGLGKLISGAEIVIEEMENFGNDEIEYYYSIDYNGKRYTQLATSLSNIQDDVFPCSKADFANFILVNFSTFDDIYVTTPSYGDDLSGDYSGIGHL